MSLSRELTRLPEGLAATYELQHKLGFGSFAVVYQVRHRQTGECLAMKVVDKMPLEMRSMLDTMHKETRLLQLHSQTPHIVVMRDYVEAEGRFFLCFELCGRNLQDVVDGRPASEQEALEWARQACEGLRGLHATGVIHRDLKPANLLIDSEGSIRICDFGYACNLNEGRSDPAGTREYAAPEVMDLNNKAPQTTAVDIYSLGTCLQHFLLGRIPQGPHDIPPHVTVETRQILAKMLNPNPFLRPSADELADILEPKSQGLFGQVMAFFNLDTINEEFDGADPMKAAGPSLSTASTIAPSPVLPPAMPLASPAAANNKTVQRSPTSSNILQPHGKVVMMAPSFAAVGHRRVRSTP